MAWRIFNMITTSIKNTTCWKFFCVPIQGPIVISLIMILFVHSRLWANMALMPLLFAVKRTRKLKGKTEYHACECIHNAFLYSVSGHTTTQVAWEIRIDKWMGPNAQPHFWVSSNKPLHTPKRLTLAKFSSLYVTRQTSKSDNIDDATMVDKKHIDIKKKWYPKCLVRVF